MTRTFAAGDCGRSYTTLDTVRAVQHQQCLNESKPAYILCPASNSPTPDLTRSSSAHTAHNKQACTHGLWLASSAVAIAAACFTLHKLGSAHTNAATEILLILPGCLGATSAFLGLHWSLMPLELHAENLNTYLAVRLQARQALHMPTLTAHMHLFCCVDV